MSIKLNKLTITYGQTKVLQDISLEIKPGVLSVEGKNGSGKSTLLKVIGGILQPSNGTLLVDGNNVNYEKFAKHNVSVCPQLNELPNLLTAMEYLQIVSKLRLVECFELVSRVSRIIDFDLESTKLISDYSSGMRQKLCVLATLMGSRKVLIFDESFSSIDQESRKHLLQNLVYIIDTSQIETIIMVNHNPDYMFIESKLKRVLCTDMQISQIVSESTSSPDSNSV